MIIPYSISKINENIKDALDFYYSGYASILYGVVKSVDRKERMDKVPVLVDFEFDFQKNKGLPKYQEVIWNDKSSIQIYHKVLNSKVLEYKGSNVYYEVDCSMFVYSLISKDLLIELLIKSIPQMLLVNNKLVAFKIIDSDTNQERIFKDERGNIEYNLNKFWDLFKINYKLNFCIKLNCEV